MRSDRTGPIGASAEVPRCDRRRPAGQAGRLAGSQASQGSAPLDSDSCRKLVNEILDAKTKDTTWSQATGADEDPMPRVPLTERCKARIGNLCWDDNAKVLIPRVHQILRLANIAEDEVFNMQGARTDGSIVQMEFKDPERLQEAKSAIRSLEHQIVMPDGKKLEGKVWLDVVKTQQELKTARVIHRAYDMIVQCEDQKPESVRQNLEKLLDGKQVKVGGK